MYCYRHLTGCKWFEGEAYFSLQSACRSQAEVQIRTWKTP